MKLNLSLLVRIEFTVQMRFEQGSNRGARHFRSPFAVMQSSRRFRARESRDITVPMGSEITSAISLYDMSSSSLMMRVSRYSHGSSSIHPCSECRLAFRCMDSSGEADPPAGE